MTKAEVPLEGEEEINSTPKTTLCKNIKEHQAQGYGVNEDNDPVPDNIPNSDTNEDNPTQNCWDWDGIHRRKSAGHSHDRASLSGFQK